MKSKQRKVISVHISIRMVVDFDDPLRASESSTGNGASTLALKPISGVN